jgi:phosphoenolpyruvate carboxykinase (ATP)
VTGSIILEIDYQRFKDLFEKRNVDCYNFNTGRFLNKKVTKNITLDILKSIVTETAKFKKWDNFEAVEIMEVVGFVPNFTDAEYVKLLKKQLHSKLDFIRSLDVEKDGYNKLPQEAYDLIQHLYAEADH